MGKRFEKAAARQYRYRTFYAVWLCGPKGEREQIGRLIREQCATIAYSMLVKSLRPRAGWRFLVSPRGMNSYLCFVDDDGRATFYDHATLGSEERRMRENELYRMAEPTPHFASYLAAVAEATAFLSKCMRHGSLPLPAEATS